MNDYGPFDKPYGVLTKSGLLERAKGFIILFESIAVVLIAALIIVVTQHASTSIFFKFFMYAASIPFLVVSFFLMILGVIWVYFPEFKPQWRKRLTW